MQFLPKRARAKVMDVIASLPGCNGQAAGCSICLFSSKIGGCSQIAQKFPQSECPDVWIRLPRHKWPKSLANIEDPVVALERNVYGHPLAGLLWERQFGEASLEF